VVEAWISLNKMEGGGVLRATWSELHGQSCMVRAMSILIMDVMNSFSFRYFKYVYVAMTPAGRE
jgi:hypothetical protein